MRKAIYLSILVITIFSCKKDRHIPEAFTVAIEQEFVLRINDVAVIEDTPKLNISFTGVAEDSRCPANVQCFWEGQFVGQFTCSGCQDQNFDLTLRVNHEDINRYEDENYEIMLIEALPYPETTNPIAIEDYQLRLVITKK